MKILKILFVLISIIFTNLYFFPRNPKPDNSAASRLKTSSTISRRDRRAELRKGRERQTSIKQFLKPRVKRKHKDRLRELNLEKANEIIKKIETISNNEIDLSNLNITDEQLSLITIYLTEVKKLNLSSNSLNFLPLNFKELIKLEYLDLSNNAIKYFNPKFNYFKHGNNSLEMVANFSNLIYLNLENNKLEYIPSNFKKGLNSEIQLNVKNNPLKCYAYQFLPECCNELLIY